MNHRISLPILLVGALLVAEATAHARWMNPSNGRFQTMDSYEGEQTDPLSLHKYLYAADNPVNRLDPNGRISIKCLTPRPLQTTSGSYRIDWRFTLDKAPPEAGYIVQKVPIYRDERQGPFTKTYWEAWFVPASKDATLPSVEDYWDGPTSGAMKGTGSVHTTIKFFFKRNTGDLGDYRAPPARPDPATGWQPGDGKTWSIDLPWTDKEPAWWKNPSDNGEADASINLNTSWEFEMINSRFSTPKFQTIEVTPLSVFGM